MNARENISEQLSAYLDGELSQADAQRVEQAVASNSALTAQLVRLRSLRAMVRQLPRQHAPEDFVARVMGRVEREHLVSTSWGSGDRGILRWSRHFATAAMVLIALSIGAVVVTTILRTPSGNNPIAAVPPQGSRGSEKGFDKAGPFASLDKTKDAAGKASARNTDTKDSDRLAMSEDVYTNDPEMSIRTLRQILAENNATGTREKIAPKGNGVESTPPSESQGAELRLRAGEAVVVVASVPEDRMEKLTSSIESLRKQQEVSQRKADGSRDDTGQPLPCPKLGYGEGSIKPASPGVSPAGVTTRPAIERPDVEGKWPKEGPLAAHGPEEDHRPKASRPTGALPPGATTSSAPASAPGKLSDAQLTKEQAKNGSELIGGRKESAIREVEIRLHYRSLAEASEAHEVRETAPSETSPSERPTEREAK